MSHTPILVGCAHSGTSPEGKAVIDGLFEAIRAALPHVDVREAYVDGDGPSVADVLGTIPQASSGRSAIVVPLVLSAGYHVYTQVAQSIEGRPDVALAQALGPDRRLVDIMLGRLKEAGVPRESTMVLAVAGSTDSRSQRDTNEVAEMLRGSWEGPVRIGFAGDFEPGVAAAVTKARAYGEDQSIAVASFLLTPGVLQDRLAESGAELVAGPLAPHPDLISIVIDRYGALAH